ncbi:MAG: hypothetical protein DRP63_09165, partial [Planctomycetota bacterium]
MGEVWRVRHLGWNMDMAIKSVRRELLKNPSTVIRFLQEAKVWVNLGTHPNIVTCFYVREIEDMPLIFTEFIGGGTLSQWISNGTLYSGGHEQALKRILDIAVQFCRGLAHSHRMGLIHQDVKPSNLLLTCEGEAKVTDFGLARARRVLEPAGSMPPQQMMRLETLRATCGGYTPAYASPEQLGGQKLTRRTDIWSWAVSLLEMFAGEVFWGFGSKADGALRFYLDDSHPKPPHIPPMPAQVAELLQHCLQQDPQKRPHDFSVVEQKLLSIWEEVFGDEYPRSALPDAAPGVASLVNRGISLIDLGEEEEATRLLEEAARKAPDYPEAVYNRGVLLLRSRKRDDIALMRELDLLTKSAYAGWRLDYMKACLNAARYDYQSALKILGDLLSQRQRPEFEALTCFCHQTARSLEKVCSLFHLLIDGTTVSCAFTGQGGRIFLGFWDGLFLLVSRSTEGSLQEKELRATDAAVTAAVTNRERSHAVLGTGAGDVFMLNLGELSKQWEATLPDGGMVTALSALWQKGVVVAGDTAGRVHIWGPGYSRTLQAGERPISALSVADGESLHIIAGDVAGRLFAGGPRGVVEIERPARIRGVTCIRRRDGVVEIADCGGGLWLLTSQNEKPKLIRRLADPIATLIAHFCLCARGDSIRIYDSVTGAVVHETAARSSVLRTFAQPDADYAVVISKEALEIVGLVPPRLLAVQ